MQSSAQHRSPASPTQFDDELAGDADRPDHAMAAGPMEQAKSILIAIAQPAQTLTK
jgi:hypothetical protein